MFSFTSPRWHAFASFAFLWFFIRYKYLYGRRKERVHFLNIDLLFFRILTWVLKGFSLRQFSVPSNSFWVFIDFWTSDIHLIGDQLHKIEFQRSSQKRSIVQDWSIFLLSDSREDRLFKIYLPSYSVVQDKFDFHSGSEAFDCECLHVIFHPLI